MATSAIPGAAVVMGGIFWLVTLLTSRRRENYTNMTPWPRTIVNFPIIMIAIAQEYIWAATLIWAPESAVNVTTVAILAKFINWEFLGIVLFSAATLAAAGFSFRNRINTMLALIPQQLLLYLSAGGAIEAIWYGRFADGVERTSAFLLADQCPAFLLAIFHTYAMFLILRYSEETR